MHELFNGLVGLLISLNLYQSLLGFWICFEDLGIHLKGISFYSFFTNFLKIFEGYLTMGHVSRLPFISFSSVKNSWWLRNLYSLLPFLRGYGKAINVLFPHAMVSKFVIAIFMNYLCLTNIT